MWNGGLVNNAQTELCVTAGNSVTWSNATLAGTGAYAKTGPGVLTLSNVNTYSGGTTVATNGGVLEISGQSVGTGGIRGTVTVNTGGELRATGY